MSQLNLNDSDCFIEEENITCITINDSQNLSDEEEAPPPPKSFVQEMEDGEVLENESDDMQKDIICEIKFPSKNEFKQFGMLLTNSLRNILKNHLNQQFGQIFEIVEEENENYVRLTVQEEKQFPHPIAEIPMPEENAENFKKDTSPDLSGLTELFTIDTAPTPKIDCIKVPSYKRAIKDALLDEEAAAQKKKKAEQDQFKLKKVSTCFNCRETGHSIRECSKPHNAKRIKNAKRSSKVERYHVDIEQRFSHLKPGCISDKLREALGLRKGEIPFFFYRMRVLGYPPGWLEDAKVEHSGINLFNSDGSKILQSDEDEGEIDAINHKYNVSKIYEFPGFNQHPGENFFDDYKYHNVPPLDKGQMREEFIKTLGDNVLKGYKRKKLKDFPNATVDNNVTIHEATDMEIEDPEATNLGEVQFTRPPPPADQPATSPPPPPPLPCSSPSSCESPITVSECRERETSTQSPSLIELEKQKRRLLRELQSNTTTTTTETEDSLIDEIIELDEGDKLLSTEKTCENIPKSRAEATENTNENITTIIKESFMGTPVLKFSAYDNLPNGENFKVGVSDVINFENLPDSTGKYEQMKKVIKKVRYCVTKLQTE